MPALLHLVLALLAITALDFVLAVDNPNPIPRVYPDNNLLDNTLYGLALGSNNHIQDRIAALENQIGRAVNKGERLLNQYINQVEDDIVRVATANGIANIDASITYIGKQLVVVERNIFSLVRVLIQAIRAAVERIERQILNETQASLAAGVVRSAISRINRLVEETIQSIQWLLERARRRVNAIITDEERRAKGLRSNTDLQQLVAQAKAAVDQSILNAENETNQRIWDAFNRVRQEAKPLTALLHSLL